MVSRFGRYELLQSLGQGGMGEVFLARQRGVGGFEKRLVIKRVLPRLAKDPRFLRLFFEEARLHAGLSHGNLVSIFDFGRVANDYFLAMELVDGCDLAALLRVEDAHCLPHALVAYIAAELCHGLLHVHRRGLVHRDLTPRNILLSLDGEVKLADFGVARGTTDESGGVRGTPAYMAPEQARGEVADARADLYALGIIIAEAATGRRVRQARVDERRADVLRLVATGDAVAIEGPFAELVARATASARADRYSDAGEMGVALEAVSARLETPRASAAQQLAERVRHAAPRVEAAHRATPPPHAEGPATYFRDSTTEASIVDDILAPASMEAPLTGAVRPRVAVVAGLAVLLLIATGAMVRSQLERRSLARVITPVVVPVPMPPPAVTTRAAIPTPEPIEPPAKPLANAVVSAPARRESPRTPAAVRESPRTPAAVEVRCAPWCVVSVDGHARGEDGQRHVLHLAPGRHRLIVERIEDRQERTVDVGTAPVRALEFVFD